jgi:hypothetical protein
MLMLLATPACSDSDDDGGKNVDPKEEVATLSQTPLTVNSDQADLSARVSNYAAMRRTNTTRAVSEFIMEHEPDSATVAAAESLTGSGTKYIINQTCKVPTTYTAENPAEIDVRDNATVYIAGHARVRVDNAYNSVIYVLSGGSATWTTGYIGSAAAYYAYGETKFADGVTSMGTNDWNKDNTPLIAVTGDLDCSNVSVSLNGGTLYVGNAFTCKSVIMSNNANLIVGCGTYLGSDVNVNGGSSLDLRGNATVDGKLTLSSGANLTMSPGILLKAQTLELNNDEVAVNGTEYTFIEADLISASCDSAYVFTKRLNGPFAILCQKIIADGEHTYVKGGYWDKGSTYYDLEFLSDVLFNEQIAEKGLTIPTSCSKDAETNTDTEKDPDPNPNPQPDPEPKKVLEEIAVVDPDHTHDISSTGIDLANGKIYVSWHERGNGYHGCVEIGQVADDTCQLLQFFETPASSGKLSDKSKYGKDFNHIIVDTKASPNRIYVVGNEFDGGLLGYVDLEANGLVNASSGSAAALNYRRLWGADGNCIIRNGDYLQLATTYGYESYALPSLDRAARDTMPGRAKFIVKDDSRIVGMHYQTRTYRNTNIQTKLNDEDDNTTETKADGDNIQEVDITIDEFPTTDYVFEQRKEIFSTGLTVAPVNGKNVVALDGTDIYLCRGALGLTRIAASGDTTNFVLPFTQGVLPRGYVNGVYVDANYVYVAYGSAGLYVLNKKDFSVVAQHTNVGGKSANFVKVDDKYIYVAYGRSGWHVYKLVDVK